MRVVFFLLLLASPMATAFTMSAWVAESGSAQYFSSNAAVPKLGDLHKLYSDLPGDCEVLVNVLYSSVSPSDINPSMATFPHVTGSDLAGVVVAQQGSCSRFKVGDSVWADIGANTKTASGEKTKELGGYGEFTLALESQLGHMPANIGFQEAGALPKVALTSYKALGWYADAINGTLWNNRPTVLILGGSGGVGTTGIQLARFFGAGQIITTTSAANSAYCLKLGADRTIDYHTQNWWDSDVIADNSIDVVFDTVGQRGTGDYAMNKLKSGGFYVTIVGALATKVKPGVTQTMFINSDTNLSNEPEMNALTKIIEANQLRMPSISSTYYIADMDDAFAESRAGHTVGKISIAVSANMI